jgi:phosphatidate cytidylyltransferase
VSERNLVLRIASAVVGLPLLGLLVLWREPLGFAVLALLAVALGLYEFGQLTLAEARPRSRAALVLVGTLFAVAVYIRPDRAFAWAMAVVILLGFDVLLAGGELRTAPARMGLAVLGVFYVAGLLVAMPLLHRDVPSGHLWVATAIAVTFANDTGAYLFGRTLGRHKLAPTISPGKTIEGAVGGLLVGIAFMLTARATYFDTLSLRDALVIGAAAGVLGPAGDLLESMMKRAVGAKDSGRMIPGHGGILDRIDALLFVGAYVYLHARLLR